MNDYSSLLEENGASIEGVWAYFLVDVKLPRQGFKIHVSAHLGNYETIYKNVSKYLIKKQIPFKAISSFENLQSLNTGLLGLSQVGKFMTVYPGGGFETCLEELSGICKGEEGPIIPSDLRYKQSNIYFRYGVIMADDEKEDFLLTPAGKYIPDVRDGSQVIPEWIDFKQKEQVQTNLLEGIIITRTLRLRGRGGIYSGLLKKENKVKKVILKEARPFGEYISREDNSKKRILNEYKVLKKISHLNIAPEVFEKRQDSEHYFLILEKLDGKTLKEIIIENSNFPKNFINKFKEYLEQTINILHLNNIYHGDISPDNIIINEKINLIDFEHSVIWKNKKIKLNFGTKGFYPMDQDNEKLSQNNLKDRDFYGLDKCIQALNNPNWYKELISV